MRFDVLTLHPGMVEGPLRASVLGRALGRGAFLLHVHDIRAFATDRHRSVDDAPFGGGPGMVMKVDVVARALAHVRDQGAGGRVALLSAGGRTFRQEDARRLAKLPRLILLCGHYEGLDARVEALVDEEISLGDFVLTGGEIAAVAVIDAVARLLPGVLGNACSPTEESFAEGLLEYPQYTRPAEWEGRAVPDVLLSGNHARIRAWRHEQALERTRLRRPDLYRAWQARVDGRPEEE